jgi:hypothetical protein
MSILMRNDGSLEGWPHERFARFAWAVLVWNVLVILWGAYVRASGSGAGCGNHWPLCDGSVMLVSPNTHKIIEFIHRAMTGLDTPLIRSSTRRKTPTPLRNPPT